MPNNFKKNELTDFEKLGLPPYSFKVTIISTTEERVMLFLDFGKALKCYLSEVENHINEESSTAKVTSIELQQLDCNMNDFKNISSSIINKLNPLPIIKR